MRSKSVFLLAFVAILAACDDPVDPDAGVILVQVTKSGAGNDANGFKVSIDDGAKSKTIAGSDTASFEVTPGSHKVALTDVATNCTVGGTNPRTVTVAKAKTEVVAFTVTCAAS